MKKVALVFWLILMLLQAQTAFAKKLAPEAGFVETFKSANGLWRVEITYKGYPQDSPSDCSFFEGDYLQWQREIPLTPGRVLVADNGCSIVMTRWGWYDEDGAKGLLFYNKEGDLLKEVAFSDDPSRGSLLWMDAFVMAADGSYCIVASHWRDQGEARLRLYDCRTGNLVWRRSYMLEREIIEPVQVRIANGGRMILVAAYNYSTADMAYFVLDKQGDILWQESFYHNFTWDKKDYIRMDEKGFNFEVFDRAQNRYRCFQLEDRRVIEL
ncbi:MAG: hypothetical protein ABIC68_04510 [Candidatus Omnitrophota bacterium]